MLELSEGWFRFLPKVSSVEVNAEAPGHAFSARGFGLEGQVYVTPTQISDLAATFPLQNLDAGDALRNHELARFLRGKHLSQATARIESGLLRIEEGVLVGSGSVRLTVGDARTETTLEFTGRLPSLEARFETSFTALGTKPPGVLFLKVRDRLRVRVQVVVAGAGAMPPRGAG